MTKVIALFSLAFWTGTVFCLETTGPNIQCTVVKVHFQVQILGFKKFPKIYQSLNNMRESPILRIAGQGFPQLNPISVMKTEEFEKIIIPHNSGTLELALKGKPISRQGTLLENGRLIADLTCH